MPDNAHIVIPSSSTSSASSSRAFPPRSQSMYLERGLSSGSGSIGRQDSYDGQYSDHEDGSYHQTVNYSDYEPQVVSKQRFGMSVENPKKRFVSYFMDSR